MVYSPNKVVACVKVDGKVLREDGNTVTLPFGSEYSVLVKNLNSTRIKVRVSIDGTDATENVWLVVQPNSDMELERFIRNGNLNSGNRLKFIERTEAIEQHRGIKADDGLIRIEYQVEKTPPVVEKIYREYIDDYRPWHPCFPRRPVTFGGDDLMRSFAPSSASRTKGGIRGQSMGTSVKSMGFMESDSESLDMQETSAQSDKGITVPGSESNQSFTWTSSFETGPSEVIILQLRGKVGNKKAVKAVLVSHKPKCVTCGRVNKANSKFCSQCGTTLQII